MRHKLHAKFSKIPNYTIEYVVVTAYACTKIEIRKKMVNLVMFVIYKTNMNEWANERLNELLARFHTEFQAIKKCYARNFIFFFVCPMFFR